MAFVEHRSRQNRLFRTWPFRRRMTATTTTTTNNQNNANKMDSELDLTRRDSVRSIFVTESSRSLNVGRQNIPLHSDTIVAAAASTDFRNITTTHFNDDFDDDDSLAECPICCNGLPDSELKQMPCCSTRLCTSCLLTHTITMIRNGKAKIECPACSQDINSSTILYDSELPVSIRERYQQSLAQQYAEKQNTYIKLCPYCNFITFIDEKDSVVRGKTRRSSPASRWIRCEHCQEEWCWSCYSPAHPEQTCRQFRKDHTNVDHWAKSRRTDNNQRNAQRCPKCSIYIEKIDGCDHMLCSKCNSRFCYRCGSRMRLPFYIGHDAKYSIFGCKHKLFPNRPALRWLIRGSIFAGLIILTPVVLGALIALVAIGIPTVLVIGCLALPVFMCIECKKRN